MERLDKIIATALQISRKDAIALIKKGRIAVNKETIKDPKAKFDENGAVLFCDNEQIYYNKYVYIMMNKPKGVISASNGKGEKTVVDILPPDMKRKNLFPAGRLDKDTTGFMLITDDGELAHSILSPKNHIPKTYIAKLDKPFNKCLGASLEPVDGDYQVGKVIIKQGMYHQIKRMFSHFSINVVELKRIKMGSLDLDENLKPGECRYLTKEEISALCDK